MSSWISVNERLPDEEGCYLTFWPDGEITTFAFDGSDWDLGWSKPLGYSGTITHWQPLPKPPEQEK